MHGLLIAAADHAPPVDHGVALLALVVIAAVGGVVYWLRRERGGSDRGPSA